MIHVLMATYHADKAMLNAQTASILSQRGVRVHLVVREDDCGAGACANFSSLLDGIVPELRDDDYIAFSDQDDVWLDDKLARSMAKMHELEQMWGRDVPLLVFTDAKVVDESLHILDDSLFRRSHLNPSRLAPHQLILQNVANGNTMLLNAALVRKAVPVPDKAFMHDHWVSLVASVFGHAACLCEPTLLYRQHASNVLGGANVGLRYYMVRLLQGPTRLRTRIYAYMRQAEEFTARYPEAPACFKACVGFASRNWLSKRRMLLSQRILKDGFFRNIGLFCVA